MTRNTQPMSNDDSRYFSGLGSGTNGRSGRADPVRRLAPGPVDRDGYPVYSSDMTAGDHTVSDRIRGRTQRSGGGSPSDALDLSIGSERHQYYD